MTPTEMIAECNRIANIAGGNYYVSTHTMSGISPNLAATVNVVGPGFTQRFEGPSWEAMFAQAEAHARAVAACRDGGLTEYESWFANERLPLDRAA